MLHPLFKTLKLYNVNYIKVTPWKSLDLCTEEVVTLMYYSSAQNSTIEGCYNIFKTELLCSGAKRLSFI